ncbi:MAG: NUDIX hydrolase [Flavobacteriaceae bacterium]|nr:NUDIX hydrolase [Flavobacteriaceae bacterium]
MSISQNIKVAVDAVVFGYVNKQLQILLIHPKSEASKDIWALPGGFVRDQEGLSAAVKRELEEETGVQADYLEQLYTFGDQVNRDPRAQVISVAYFGLINPEQVELEANTDAQYAAWFPINQIPDLRFDHKKILQMAHKRLQSKLLYQPIGFELLHREFPFSDLETLYQTILGKKLDRRNFRKKILSFQILDDTGKKQKIGSGRPAQLFRFNELKYKELLNKGFHFDIQFA